MVAKTLTRSTISTWQRTAMSIEQFFKGVEERANEFPASEQARILDRLQLARESIGTQDRSTRIFPFLEGPDRTMPAFGLNA
jgi:hypothetical protein